MKNISSLVLVVLILLNLKFYGYCSNLKETISKIDDRFPDKYVCTIAFYNVENLFFPGNDSITNDDEFTPGGAYYWTFTKYYNKINNISKVLIALTDKNPPAIIGLCEIESQRVLQDLTQHSILSRLNYRYIHKESPDKRGIDVGLLYNPQMFEPVYYEVLNISEENNSQFFFTRDILYVKGLFKNGITGHFFVNHWPSRRGGAIESEWKRELMAGLLKEKIDLIIEDDPGANIIIMGDFNDEPVDKSIEKILGAKSDTINFPNAQLYNLMYKFYKAGEGTHFRKNNFIEASILDQFIISGSLYNSRNKVILDEKEAQIFKNEQLVNEKNGLPFRTYQGLKYLGGFSDHFPVYIKLIILSEDAY